MIKINTKTKQKQKKERKRKTLPSETFKYCGCTAMFPCGLGSVTQWAAVTIQNRFKIDPPQI
jgi:hypothetical protein